MKIALILPLLLVAAQTAFGASPVRYEIGSGEDRGTLYGVAMLFYDHGTYWPRIFEANRDILDDPDRIRPGMVLEIPDPESYTVDARAAAGLLKRYQTFLDAPSEQTLLDLLVDADRASSFGVTPALRAFLLEQFSQDPPPVYRVNLADAEEIDAWTVAWACAWPFFTKLPGPEGPGCIAAICSRLCGEYNDELYRFHLLRIPPDLLPAIRAAISPPDSP